MDEEVRSGSGRVHAQGQLPTRSRMRGVRIPRSSTRPTASAQRCWSAACSRFPSRRALSRDSTRSRASSPALSASPSSSTVRCHRGHGRQREIKGTTHGVVWLSNDTASTIPFPPLPIAAVLPLTAVTFPLGSSRFAQPDRGIRAPPPAQSRPRPGSSDRPRHPAPRSASAAPPPRHSSPRSKSHIFRWNKERDPP